MLQEFDLDAALARRPTIILIDELAHTNAPGLRHAKRWQDVQELLKAGITVYTTVNVQHLESLNDVVAQITGVRVRETVPDSVLERADDVELIDLPPDDLAPTAQRRKGLRPGTDPACHSKFLHQRQSDRASRTRPAPHGRAGRSADGSLPARPRGRTNLAGGGNHHGLRQHEAARPAPDQGCAPDGGGSACQMDRGLCASFPGIFDCRKPNEIVWCRPYAWRATGAETVTLTGERVAQELLNYARSRNATKIIVGKPVRSLWKEWLFGSVVSELVHQSGDIDIYVITGEAGEGQPLIRRSLRRYQPCVRICLCLGWGC